MLGYPLEERNGKYQRFPPKCYTLRRLLSVVGKCGVEHTYLIHSGSEDLIEVFSSFSNKTEVASDSASLLAPKPR